MVNYTQDLPPKEGFGNINYKSVPAKRWISNKKLGAGLLIFTLCGAFEARKNRRLFNEMAVYEKDAKNAVEPFLEAERDRNFLIHIKKNRDMEAKVMKDVPGWEPGTFYGIPFYKSFKEDQILDELIPSFNLFSSDLWARQADPGKQGLAEVKLK